MPCIRLVSLHLGLYTVIMSATTSDIIGKKYGTSAESKPKLCAGSEVLGQVSQRTSGPYGGGGGMFFTDWWASLDGRDYYPKNPPNQVSGECEGSGELRSCL